MFLLVCLNRVFKFLSCNQLTGGYFFLALVSLILGQTISANAQSSINVYVSEPRGGYGDTAANLLMIERLADHYSKTETQFRVVTSPGSVQQISQLWPDFNPNLEMQIVRGILFSTEIKAKLADVVVSFSSPGGEKPNLGRRSIAYYEYDQHKSELGTQTLFESARDYVTKLAITTLSGDYDSARINTGFGNGIYVKNGFRDDDDNKEKTLQLLKEFSKGADFSPSARLAYAYTSSPELTRQYVNALQKYAQRSGQEIVLVTNHPVEIVSDRIKVINMKGMPFDLNQKVIKSSDVPIMVTGDGSLSLAVEGRKPFFYSLYAWKRFTPLALIKQIEKASPILKKDRRAMYLLGNILRMDISGNHSYEDMFLEVMENPKLQNELSRVFGEFVKTDSLLDLVIKDADFINRLDMQKSEEYRRSVQRLWAVLRSSKNLTEAIVRVERDLFKFKKDPKTRIQEFLALNVLMDYPKERFGKIFSKALTSKDMELKSSLGFLVQESYTALNLLEIYPYLTTEGKGEFKLIFKNLQAQDKAQWSGEIKAKEALVKIRFYDTGKTACQEFYSH